MALARASLPRRVAAQDSEAGEVYVSQWAGELGAMSAPAGASERVNSVWIETGDVGMLSATSCTPADFSALLVVLQADQPLTIVHEQDDFLRSL